MARDFQENFTIKLKEHDLLVDVRETKFRFWLVITNEFKM